MKFPKFAFLLALLLLFTSACSKPSSPAEVAKAFLSEVAQANIEEAKVYASPDTVKLLDLAKKFGQLPTYDNFTFTLVKEEINDQIATVIYTNYKGENKPIRLKLIDGEWKVDLQKR